MDKNNRIAVIGANGVFPMAGSFDELDRIYSEKIDCIRDITPERIKLNGLDENKKYIQSGYLEDIDKFDYQFFGISKREAACTDPQQRIALETACRTIESAGYSLSSMRGTDTAVIVGAGDSGYRDIFHDDSGFATNGTLIDTLPGRISYLLDLHGEASVVLTACSSSLYAIYEACTKLSAGTCEMALAGGVYISFRAYEENAFSDDPSTLGLMAPDGRCKAFEDSADGINSCESCGFVLLKRLEDAVRDNDNILAVISGAGANQDGGRSNSYSSPSAAAQTELLERVWERAGLDPEQLGYIEAHGTGTKIGDPIEIASVSAAFRKYTDKKHICPVGSLKSNYAHPGPNAGTASVLKAILSINRKKKYPLRTLNKPNTMINFADSAVYPIAEEEKWDSEKRIMGINSFGVSGTNVHILIENYIPEKEAEETAEDEFLVTISAKVPELIGEYKRAVLKSIKPEYSVGRICSVLNRGRDDYRYRESRRITSIEELKNFLGAEADVKGYEERPRLVFICSGDKSYSDEEKNKLSSRYPAFKREYERLRAFCSSEAADNVCVEAALLYQMREYSIIPDTLIGTGLGNAAVRIYRENSAENIELICEKAGAAPFAAENFTSYMKSLSDSENGRIICIDISGDGILLRTLREMKDLRYILLAEAVREASLLDTLSELYSYGFDINWESFYEGKNYKKAMLAPYVFQKTSAWPANIIRSGASVQEVQTASGGEDIREYIRGLWKELLENDDIGDDDDLFDAGANSLISMSFIQKIYRHTGVKLDNEELYDYYTVNMLYDHIAEKLGSGDIMTEEAVRGDDIIPVERKERMAVSCNQGRMLYIMEESPNSAMYNLPVCYRLKGELDIQAFSGTISEIVRRHEILHTIYGKHMGEYYQHIPEKYDFMVQLRDSADMGGDELRDLIRTESERAFDLFSEIPIRCILFKRSDIEYILFVNIHHIASDGWSTGIFSAEISEIYNGKLNNMDHTLPPLKIQYADYSAYEQNFMKSEKAAEETEYWKKELSGIEGILDFPTDKKRPEIQQYHGSSCIFEIGADMRRLAEEYVRKHGMSMFMLLEGVYAILLYKYSGENDICVGVPTANRFSEDTEKMIGFFVNTIVIRSRFPDNISVADFMDENTKKIMAAFNNSHVYFDEVVKNIRFRRSPAHSAVYQYSFTYQNFIQSEVGLKNVSVEAIEPDITFVKSDMNFILRETKDNILICAEYDRELFSGGYIREIAGNYRKILKAVISGSSDAVQSIGLDTSGGRLTSGSVSESLF